MNARDLRRVLPGVLISIVLLVVVFSFVDFDFREILDTLLNADVRLIFGGIVFFFISLFARAVGWRILLLEQASFSRVFYTVNEGYLLNNILPFRLGEIARALIMSGTTSLGFWQVLSTIVIERAFDLILAAGILLATIPFVFQVEWAVQAAVVVLAVVVLGLVFLYLLAKNRERALSFYDRICARWQVFSRLGRERIESFFTGLAALTDASRFIRALGWMALVWGLTLVEYYLILLAFDPEAEFVWAAFSLGLLALGVAVPSAPGSLGVYEASLVGALLVFGVDPAIALAYAITTHFLFVFLTGVIGFYALLRDGLSIGRIYQQARSEIEQGPALD
ncbi:MAG: lysylphosphatidylglycerol synthase transmembrane domain-containing protein [Anaerolineales bacterium]|nr:lysylphosphatidylglycerol synthase transmembrane domain-containing protein [Anaerolineales bacterium]